ncbi:DUF2938 domain-containing protein [Permianibacter aggregans]|uniref:DUF2938 family protein n=1 Tax=Permianibacter aggregans TaxID=1510150 RepID=A0A4V3D7P9_9GAMM|nr:DUF2938 domain-containing protein [Permianibacter aggregans]QGX40768.1 DUF2938 domain-containing protein [Permianibacter aggregans]TDQ48417.1 DUF2938 family protein [Permianibacter aggregans]
METLISIVLIGAGATIVTDIWSIIRQRLFSVPPPNFGFVGRWMAYCIRGHFHHDAIAKAAPIKGELFIGWFAHYVIGIAFAAMLVAIWGVEWIRQPTLAPALLVSVATVSAPFLIMQPCMGAGIAASRLPNPGVARLHSLITHAVFGVGLFVAALLAKHLLPVW